MPKKIFLLTVSLLLTAACTRGIVKSGKVSGNWNDPLPVDPFVTIGKLENGLTYYVRQNSLPADRIELRLVVNAGSVLEDEDERGLAHYVEHMAFNGTENFEKQEIVNFLESLGMRFGADLNASTGFDATTYILQVPTDNPETLDKAFLILRDWASGITFDPDEVEKERGVIIEEWRIRRGAQSRMLDRQLPVLLSGSRYAERLPIGSMEVVGNATPEDLRRFYERWYRPELMAVIAVGDLDSSTMEEYIKKYFSGMGPDETVNRPVYEVPDHEETLYTVASDPEATRSRVSVYIKHEPESTVTEADYRRMLGTYLFTSMLNNRLSELAQKPSPPFLGASTGYGRFVRSKNAFTISAEVEDNRITEGLSALITEAERARVYGFTPTELARQKQVILSIYESAWLERDKTRSGAFVSQYVSNFLDGSPVPGIDFEFHFAKEVLPSIALEEVNELARKYITDTNRVILANSPEKEGIEIPGQDELALAVEEAVKAPVEAYEDTLPDGELVEFIPIQGQVESENNIEQIGVIEWVLSNGARVILKPTDFKNDEILMTAFSPGGYSVIPEKWHVPAVTASSIIAESGLGNFNRIDLEKMLAGRQVSISTGISQLQETIRGVSAPRDIETFFQLLYLNFTSPREDSLAYQTLFDRLNNMARNRSLQPESAFQDTLSQTLWDYHPRSRPLTPEWLEEMDLGTSIEIFRDRFRDPGDFTFIFVGAFEPSSIKPLIETYIGGLPDTGRRETWKDTGMRYAEGAIEKTVYRGIEPRSLTSLQFTGPFEWSRVNHSILQSLAGVLRIGLREKIREELGGTYNVSVSASTIIHPVSTYRISISFGSDPARAQELASAVLDQIKLMFQEGTVENYLPQVKEMQLRSREVQMKENSFWLEVLNSYYFRGESPEYILEYPSVLENITSEEVRQAAIDYFDMKNYLKVVLYPED